MISPVLHHFRIDGVSLVLDATPPGLPRVVHWGADLGETNETQLRDLLVATRCLPPANALEDEPMVLSLLPENGRSWVGTPGLVGHRGQRDFSALFTCEEVHATVLPDGTQRLTCDAADADAQLGLNLTVDLLVTGLVRLRATVVNRGAEPYDVDALTLALPVPLHAEEIVDFGGRWGHERSPQRHPFVVGTHLREGRHGRTGHDATLLLLAGETGFGFRRGEIWGVHTAWSGHHRTLAERLSTGDSMLAGGELLLPGEVRLAQGAAYTTPWVFGSYGTGMDAISRRFHRHLRSLPSVRRRPRPVTGNCWEAVAFDHAAKPLMKLADAFAEAGVERFVLDDGWFRHRRDDRAGLGDWYVDQTVWPHGLHPLVDHVRARGMEFGLWVEPEMVNADSDLAREHPDWILAPGNRLPPEVRHQQVLDLGHRKAFEYILERLDALVSEYRLTYLKWDHNRDLIEPGHQACGRAAVHDQTVAAYRLMDLLKERHPGLEIESCSSGGARIDGAVLERTDRIWCSDVTDAHERQQIQRYTGLLVPPEMLGAHISADPNEQSQRRLSIEMRAITAMFADLGVEWNIAEQSASCRERLAQWIACYKRWRDLLHSGEVVRLDHPDPALWVHGVIAQDRSEALFALVPMAVSDLSPMGVVRFDALDPEAHYWVRPVDVARRAHERLPFTPPPWWGQDIAISGRALMGHGIQLPALPPDYPALISLTSRD
jgi:alpha-galactosidase